MAAFKSGSGSAAMKSMRDKAMAAYMKKHKVERRIMRDPISHKIVPINSHVMTWGRK